MKIDLFNIKVRDVQLQQSNKTAGQMISGITQQ